MRCPIRSIHLGLLAAALAAFTAVGPSAYSAPQTPSLPAGGYVALGDSYASGVGAPPYDDDGCKRAAGAYAHQVAGQTGKTLDFGACAGARTKDFYQPGKEAAQLDHLNASTSLVTFSIGGNDAGFARILGDCIGGGDRGFLSAAGCSSDAEVTGAVDGAIDALAGKTTRADITSYDTLVADIAARAPGATVVAVGYPRMFTPQGAGQILPVPGRCEGVTKVDQRWINAKTNEINAAAKAAALMATLEERPDSTSKKDSSDVDEAIAAEAATQEKARRRHRRRVFVGSLVLLATLVGASALFYRWTQTRYYVSTYKGEVAIYQGIPQSVGPLKLSHSVKTYADLPVESLDHNIRERLQATVTQPSMSAAETYVDKTVRSYRKQAATPQGTSSPTAKPSSSSSSTPSPASATPTQPAKPGQEG